jgi:hypothetical protein
MLLYLHSQNKIWDCNLLVEDSVAQYHWHFAKEYSKLIDSVAQLVEHYTFNVGVLGSNPSGITIEKKPFRQERLFYLAER